MSTLSERADGLPTTSGVYLFRDQKRRVLYVGKAVNLRARVRQYLAGHDERMMVPHLVAHAHDVEVIATRTEKEALLLENTLIKKHRPRYNIKLRDDSNFLHLRIDTRTPWPRYTLVRRIESDGARYFGPYASATRARRTLAFVQRHFALRTCSDQVLKARKRPCLLYQMGRCAAPCVDAIDEATYDGIVSDSVLFLEGRRRPLIQRLTQQMEEAAEILEYEKAARFRDLIRGLQTALERQHVVDPRLRDRDVWGSYREGTRGALAVLPIREGAMGEPRCTQFDGEVADDADLISSALNTAYPEGADIPREILLPAMPHDAHALADVLSERAGYRVSLSAPIRGDRVRLVELAAENARLKYMVAFDAKERTRRALEDLAELLELNEPPRRIECFDNSNIGGVNPVAAMSVFIDGEPVRSEYRRYKVKTVVGSDDYATMREILQRRVRRAQAEDQLADLFVVDGGHGQVAVARAVLDDAGLRDVPVVGIAKPRTERQRGDRQATDKIVLPHRRDPLRPRRDHAGLRILQHLRDEVHRHAVNYHRKLRRKSALDSVLEDIPGVGKERRRALLRTLGSAKAVVGAQQRDLAAVPGIGPALAARIYSALHPESA